MYTEQDPSSPQGQTLWLQEHGQISEKTCKPTAADYTIGIICAFPIELAAVTAALDEEDEEVEAAEGDVNIYTLGRISSHGVVIACPPRSISPIGSAKVVSEINRSFPELRCLLSISIGSGVPNHSAGVDIRLGDVVVAVPNGTNGGLIWFDINEIKDSTKPIPRNQDTLISASRVLLSGIAKLQARHLLKDSEIPQILKDIYEKNPRVQQLFSHPGSENDLLFESTYNHQDPAAGDCRACDVGFCVRRCIRENVAPLIHYGTIASSRSLLRHASQRDLIRKRSDVLCVEMEGAGMMNASSCLLIRGICDYADSHANEKWRPTAVLAAVAYCKELLRSIPPKVILNETAIRHIEDKQMSTHASQSTIDRMVKDVPRSISALRHTKGEAIAGIQSYRNDEGIADNAANQNLLFSQPDGDRLASHTFSVRSTRNFYQAKTQAEAEKPHTDTVDRSMRYPKPALLLRNANRFKVTYAKSDTDGYPLLHRHKRKFVETRPLLACLFHKKDPWRYRVSLQHRRKYKTCPTGFQNAHRLKDHMKRVHSPGLVCQTCCSTFKSEEKMKQHRKATCQYCADPEKRREIEFQQTLSEVVSRKKPAHLPQEQFWYATWQKLFPGSSKPSSPYQDDSEAIHNLDWLKNQIVSSMTDEWVTNWPNANRSAAIELLDSTCRTILGYVHEELKDQCPLPGQIQSRSLPKLKSTSTSVQAQLSRKTLSGYNQSSASDNDYVHPDTLSSGQGTQETWLMADFEPI